MGDAGLELEEAESVPNAVPGWPFTNDVRKISGYFISLPALLYRVAHLLWERIMLTPNLKLRLAVSFPSDRGHQRNFEFDVNIFLSRSR